MSVLNKSEKRAGVSEVLAHQVSDRPRADRGTWNRRKKTSVAMAGAISMLVPFITGNKTAMATTWDPSLGGTFNGSGGGNWDAAGVNPNNTVWWNGTTDVTYPSDVATFTGTAGPVTLDQNLSPTGIIFGVTGYTISGTNTLTIGASGITTAVGVTGVNETINTPIILGSSGNGVYGIDGTLNLGGSILQNSSGNLSAATTGSSTFIFTGDMSLLSSGMKFGGGNVIASLDHIVNMVYSSTVVSPTATVGAGVFGTPASTLSLAYQANLNVTTPLNIAGELALTGGGNQGLGDLSLNGETISGTASINVGFNANNLANTTVASAISGNAPLAFVAGNTSNFLTNNLTGGNTLTIGQAGASTSMALGSSNSGRELTVAGTGTTVINSQIVDGNKGSNFGYYNSALAYNGTGGSLTVANGANAYRGGTQIQQGTLKLGANNALPTGLNLGVGVTGGTPGLVIFGDVDGTKAAGGILDLAGFNQTVAGLSVAQTGTVPAGLGNAAWVFTANGTAVGGNNGTSSFIPLAGTAANGFILATSGLAVGEAISFNNGGGPGSGGSGTITGLFNGGSANPTLNVGLSFDPVAGTYGITAGSITLTAGAATATSQIIGNSSTSSNSVLTFAGVNTFASPTGAFLVGEGTNPSSIFGGIIQDSVNGGTMNVGLTVASGTLALTGQNTYTGTTTINGGELNVGSVENPGVSGPMGKSAAVNPGSIVFGGGAIQYSAANQTDYSARFSTAANQLIGIDTNSQTVTLSTPLTSSGGTLTKLGLGTLNLPVAETYTGTTTVKGGLLNVTGSLANNNSASIIVADTAVFGTNDVAITRPVPASATYAGLGAAELSAVGNQGSKGDLLQGANSSGTDNTVTMQWRARTAADDTNLQTQVNGFNNHLASDVMQLTNMANAGTPSGQTDPFTLQLTYNPNIGSSNFTDLYLASMDGGNWQNAVATDFGTGGSAVSDYVGSYAAFASANGITDANIATFLGSWGVDQVGDTAWAIVNHNSQFAVADVPEPATLGLLAVSSVGLLSRRRSRKARSV